MTRDLSMATQKEVKKIMRERKKWEKYFLDRSPIETREFWKHTMLEYTNQDKIIKELNRVLAKYGNKLQMAGSDKDNLVLFKIIKK